MGKYTGSVATTQRQQVAFDDALAESDRKKVEMQDFEYTERTKFEKKAKSASKGVKRKSGILGALGGVAAVALGAAALPAALIAGGATLAGGMIGKYTGQSGRDIKAMKKQRFFKSDRDDILSGINKQLLASTASNAVLAGVSAGSAAKGGDAVVLGQDQAGKAVKETVVNQAKTGTFEIAGEGAKKNVQSELDKTIGQSINEMVGLPKGDGVRELAQSSSTEGFLASGKPNYAMQKKITNATSSNPAQMNTITTMPTGSTQYQNLTTSKWFGGGTAQPVGSPSLTFENMGNNLKAAYRGVTGTEGAISDNLKRLQTGKTLLDWYNQDEQGGGY